MKYTINDIKEAARFAVSLKSACQAMLEGKPKSQALASNDISLTTYDTLIKGLRRESGGVKRKLDRAEELRHPAWQDELIYDLCEDEKIYLPSDFEDELKEVEKKYLTDEETAVINKLYIEGKKIPEIAKDTGLSEPTVRTRRDHAMKALRSHVNEMILGKKYIDGLDELESEYDRHVKELKWMRNAIEYLRHLSYGLDSRIEDEQDLTDEEKKFYRINEFSYLADVMNVDVTDLFIDINDAADEEGAFLALSGDRKGISPDARLSDMDFSPKTVNAFHDAGLETVGNVLNLSEKEALNIRGIGYKQIVHLYRRVIFG